MADLDFLKMAIAKAKESTEKGGFPAGGVVAKDGNVIGTGISIGNVLNDPTSHGEIAAIRDAAKNLGTKDLTGAILYASMQPCAMCHAAAMWASLSRIVYALPKDQVNPEYYCGHVDLAVTDTYVPVELVHLAALEAQSLATVKDWESKQV
jgi:guanine deaminase